MFLIQEILVSDELAEVNFCCDLNECKGACCWEGDFGAPLEKSEMEQIKELFAKIKHLLPEKNLAQIEKEGLFTYFDEPKLWGTSLMDDASCVFMLKDENGIAQCSFEKAQVAGLSKFKKPISCHLYPVRVTKNEKGDFEALNFDNWDICHMARKKGDDLDLHLTDFLKEALIRAYGEAFYEELIAAIDHLSSL